MAMSFYRLLLFVKVFIQLFADGEELSAYLGPPLPPETLGFRAFGEAAADPDYPPSTCCVRVVRIGSGWSVLRSQMIRGQGRIRLWAVGQCGDLDGLKTRGKK